MTWLKILGKAIGGLLLAFIFLNAFCFFYFFIPKVKKSDGGTAASLESNHLWCYGYEGFSFGKTNNEGYNNLVNYEGQKIDVLIMGSSHMEALFVPMNYNVAAVYNRINEKGYFAYNIGVEGFTFAKNCTTFEKALDKYEPDVVIFELNDLYETKNNLNKLNEGKLTAYEESGGLIDKLSSFPFIRALVMQYLVLLRQSFVPTEHKLNYGDELTNVMANLRRSSENHNCRLIFMYHPHLTFRKDGGVDILFSEEELDIFETACIENGIEFVNLGEDFLAEYYEKAIVPHGFINSELGTGHLNKDGHRIFAEKMNELIK